MKLSYRFPDREKRNSFLCLCDARVGRFGIGCGLEFVDLRFSLESDKGSGRLKCLRSNACGDWKITGNTVEIDWGFIETRQDFKKLLEQLSEVARRFGEGTGGGGGGYGDVRIKF